MNGGCSVVSNEEGLFDAHSNDCFNKNYFYCQYIREPTTVELGNKTNLL
jgi:hypothetical protein